MKAKLVIVTKVGKNRFIDSFSSLISCLAGSDSSEKTEIVNFKEISPNKYEITKANPEVLENNGMLIQNHHQSSTSSSQTLNDQTCLQVPNTQEK